MSDQLEDNITLPQPPPAGLDSFPSDEDSRSGDSEKTTGLAENQSEKEATAGDAEHPQMADVTPSATDSESREDAPPASEDVSFERSTEFLMDGKTIAHVSPVFINETGTAPSGPTRQYQNIAEAEPGPSIRLTAAAFGSNFKAERHSSFSIGVVAGPDLSSVGSPSGFYKPGYKFGFMVEYNITSNLSLSTGAVQSVVRYSTRKQQYDPPSSYNPSSYLTPMK